MPVSKADIQWHKYLADEFGIPFEAVWVRDGSFGTNVIVWTKKLNKQQLLRLLSSGSAGGHLSLRGKIHRFLESMGAIGWTTKVRPSEAQASDLNPIAPLPTRFYCGKCSTVELLTSQDIYNRRCENCSPGVAPVLLNLRDQRRALD